jgi:L-serine dehydratase
VSVFDIVGPIMIGPSSSHTAGAARLGKMARAILGEEPVAATITLYGSFARTYKGHGTDKALAGGLLNLAVDDPQIKESLTLAAQLGMTIVFQIADRETTHPNTVEFHLQGLSGKAITMTGVSIGGGQIVVHEISGFHVELTGDYYTLITIHQDKPGVIARVTQILANSNINIAQMKVSRSLRGAEALMVLETDQIIPETAIDALQSIPLIQLAIPVLPL